MRAREHGKRQPGAWGLARWSMGALAWLLAMGCGGRTLGGGQGNDNNIQNSNNYNDADTWADAGGPAVEDLGEPGWRGSTDPWTPEGYARQMAFAVWSRPEAVYVVHAEAPDSGFVGPGELPEHWKLSRNDGTGWQLQHEWGGGGMGAYPGNALLTGFPDGRLLVGGDYGNELGELAMIDGSAVTSFEIRANHTFVVGNQLAFAATDYERKVIRFDVDHWEPLPVDSPYELIRVWADEEALFGVGPAGTVVSLEDDAWRVHDSGSLADFTQVWGFSKEDVWIGAVSGELRHWDGETWTAISWPKRSPFDLEWYPIEGIWGAEGVLFFHTFHQLIRCEGSTLQCEEVGYWPCTPDPESIYGTCAGGLAIRGLWGNSPEEVFLALNAPIADAGTPDHPFLLWYDGALFHWF